MGWPIDFGSLLFDWISLGLDIIVVMYWLFEDASDLDFIEDFFHASFPLFYYQVITLSFFVQILKHFVFPRAIFFHKSCQSSTFTNKDLDDSSFRYRIIQ